MLSPFFEGPTEKNVQKLHTGFPQIRTRLVTNNVVFFNVNQKKRNTLTMLHKISLTVINILVNKYGTTIPYLIKVSTINFIG
jgi:hypothetical protein